MEHVSLLNTQQQQLSVTKLQMISPEACMEHLSLLNTQQQQVSVT